MNQLGLFAKYWEPGQVKTRLAAGIGPVAASRIYRSFVSHLLERLRHIAQRRVLAYWPPDRREEFQALTGGAWDLVPQCDGDLGKRIRHFFSQAIQAGAGRVVLLGSDSPTVPAKYVHRAFEMLEDSPVVLGPAADGGYYLVGVAGSVPPIFQGGISWGGSAVYRQSVRRIREAGLSFGELPPWYDVDRPEDLLRVRKELAARIEEDALSRKLLQQIDGQLDRKD